MARSAIGLYITICVTIFVISKIVVSCLLYKKWARNRRFIENSLSGGKMVIFRSTITQSLNAGSFMKKAMKLSNKDVIGSGGYGTVYRLSIDETTAFAVKKLNKGNTEVDRGFERELVAMGDIKHRNIVRLHGYCIAPHINLLIYELMPNGSLDCYLHANSAQKVSLDWPTRLRIGVGAARGIAYLHHDCVPHIIHRDIKSSNILLDQNMEARVSDFGLATLMEPNESHVSTAVAGTFGYLAPGKRPTDESFIQSGTKLVTWVKMTVKEKREEETIDSALVSFPISEIREVFCIVEKCLEAEPSNRPTMADVLKMLEQVK